MSKKLVMNARDVLPKALLSKLQLHCTGFVYVPSPSKENIRRDTALRLHQSGKSVEQIAHATGFSIRWVRCIVADTQSNRTSRPVSRFLKLVPHDLVGQVQQYVVGRLYIPLRKTRKTGNTKRVERLFDQGLHVAEIAHRTKLSERQVYRLKKVWLEDAWRREMDNADQQSKREHIMNGEASKSYTSLKKCPGCGRQVVEPGATYCDICENIKGDVDGNVIVLSDFPFASFDPKF